MGRPDPHDKRTFRHFAKLAADGSVAAIVEVSEADADTYDDTTDALLVDVTELYPYDLTSARVTLPTLPARPVPPVLDPVQPPTPAERAALVAYRAAMGPYRRARRLATDALKVTLREANRGRP